MSLRPETRAIFAPPRDQHGVKKLIFSKVTRSDVFDFPDHLWGFRNVNLISKVDFRPQKDEIFDFFKNRDFRPKPFWNDDFAPSNSKFSLLGHLIFNFLIVMIHGAKHSLCSKILGEPPAGFWSFPSWHWRWVVFWSMLDTQENWFYFKTWAPG